MMSNQPKPRNRQSTLNTRKVERSALGKLLHEEFLTPHKITQKRLSEVSGVAAEDISRMVTGERYPYDPTLYDNLYALFKALDELGVPLTNDQVSNVLQVKEIRAHLSDKRQEDLIDALQNDGIVKVAYQTNQQEADALYRATVQPSPIQEPPKIDNLPFRQNPFFTGRRDEIEQLRKQLQETGTATITQPISKSISISGLGGIGKTELALEYAHRFYPDVYDTALWVNAADEDTLQASYVELAKTLNLPAQDKKKLDQCIHAVKIWLKTHINWLLIMDNADDLPLAESFLPSKAFGHVVYTTRSQSIGITATESNHIVVEKMESDDGLLFLLLRSHKLNDRNELGIVATEIRDTASEVVRLLGGYPLALDQAGAYIEGTGVSFTGYINRYHNERHRLLSRRSSWKSKNSEHGRHPLPVAATLNLSIQEACEGQPLASDILHFCAFLQPDAISEELFEHDDGFKYNTTEFDEAIEALCSQTLIKRNSQQKTISQHRLVQAVIEDGMLPDIKKQWIARVMRAIYSIIPIETLDRDISTLLPHIMKCTTWEEDNTAFMLNVSYLCLAVAYSQLYVPTIGEEPILKLLERSLAIRERLLGTEHPVTLQSLYFLAYHHWNWLNCEQLELLCKEALPNFERGWGLEHEYTESCMKMLAECYCEQDKYEQAVLIWQRVLSDREKRLGTECLDVAFPLIELANLYAAIPGKLAESETLYLRAMSILEKLQLGINAGEIPQLVSEALRAQHSGKPTVAIQHKIREVILGFIEVKHWFRPPDLELPDTKNLYQVERLLEELYRLN